MSPGHNQQENRKDTTSFFRAVKDNWVVIATLIGIIMAWANMGTALANLQDRTKALETKSHNIDTQQNQILVQLSSISTDLQWIKTKINQ